LDVIFGYFVIFACGISKLPQVQTVSKTRIIQGLSVSSILLELYCHGLNTGFFIHESYPLVNYLEYPLLIVQNFVLIYIIGEVTNSIIKSVFTIAAFITFIYVVGIGAIPKYLLVAALGANSLIGVISKLAQIRAIRGAGNSDSVSYMFYVMMMVTSSMRVYTNMIRINWEAMVVLNLVVSVISNAAVTATISIYRGRQIGKDKKED